LLSACSTNENQIRKIAFGYLDAMGNYRISDAYRYASTQTQNTTLKYIETNIMPKADTASLMRDTPAIITITNINMTSDTTASVMFHKSTPLSEKNNILNMIKENGHWCADVVIAEQQNKALSSPKTSEIDTNYFRNKTFKVVNGATPPPIKH